MVKKRVCVDLDGVLASYDVWKGVEHIGEPIPGAQEFMAELAKDFDVWIFTTRCNAGFNDRNVGVVIDIIYDWLKKHEIPFDYIYAGQGKPMAIAFVDDRAVSCKPQENPDAFRDALVDLEKLHGS